MSKGITFTEEMFNAVIEGRKTQTRRIMKQQPSTMKNLRTGEEWICKSDMGNANIKPRYKVGERVYLKEPYHLYQNNGCTGVMYKHGTGCTDDGDYIWKNKLFMPEKYARHFIEITDVRAERLCDISDQDCFKEGISARFVEVLNWWQYGLMGNEIHGTPQEAYAALIDKIYGKGTWAKNPFVFVYTFKLIK